ncbi:MAG: hypothetical protein Phog2KO_32710 [Phototrophicaceae bacterium]
MQIPRDLKTWILSLLLLGILGAMLIGLTLRPIYGADFYFVYYPAAQNLLNGDAILYTYNTPGYFNPAHGMFYWLAIATLPLNIANTVHIMVTFTLLIIIVRLWSNHVGWSTFKVLLALAGLYTVDHIIRGQVDVIALFGLILAFEGAKRHLPYLLGLGATIAMIKFGNLLLPLLLIAWSLRKWNIRDILKAAIIPSLTIIATMLVFGADWGLRLYEKLSNGLPYDALSSLSTWQLAEALSIPVIVPIIISVALLFLVAKYRELTVEHIALAIVVNFLISNYVAGYHFVALIPAILCIRHRGLVFIAWLLSLMPLVRIISQDLAWLMLLLPIFIGFVLLWQITHPLTPESEIVSPNIDPELSV